jgi:acetylornithine deacetylase/succinyl-diaminopimelate desuccinylase-like protein
MEEGASYELRVIKAWPPVLMEQDHPLVQTLAGAFEAVFQRRPELRGKAASTDASFIYGLAGVPVVLYGPGLPTLAHMADEYVEVQALVRASHIYTLTALGLLA